MESDWDQPQEVDDLMMAFPGVLGSLMPSPEETGPEEDQDPKWLEFQRRWFGRGLPETTEIAPREGIDPEKAFRHLTAIQRSYEPKHEHKTAAVAWLASKWFAGITYGDEDS